jgi:hypothetical protein
VTQWGLDPLWDTALPKHRTRVSDFPGRVADEQVSLRELTSTTVHVIGHRVRWDGSRRMWYCDIDLDPGTSYMPFVRLALVRYQPNALADAKISKVSLADFSQVLPRRRAVFQRNATQLTFRLYGNVPQHGPMQFPMESEYQDVSFPPPLGQPGESGRNKVELVLQTRDETLVSDLAWSDVKVLASTLAAPAGLVVQPTPLPDRRLDRGAARAEIPATVADRLGQRFDVSSAVDRGALARGEKEAVTEIGIDVGRVVESAIWEPTVTLPDVGGKPARIAVREYERYYTDRTVPERRGGTVHLRRVVEERLVFTAFFDL